MTGGTAARRCGLVEESRVSDAITQMRDQIRKHQDDKARLEGDLASLAPPGFEVDSHEITLYGRCSDCAAQPA